MSLPLYSTWYLNNLIERLAPQPRYFLDRFFPTEVQSDKEEVYFDETEDQVGLSPFVHPLNEAPLLRNQGYKTKSFKPAYIKEKANLTPDKGFTRLPGEPFGGSLPPEQRAAQQLIKDTSRLYERLQNRLELMAVEVCKTGKLTIKGEGIDAVLDFGRDKSLTKSLSGNNAWSNKALPMTTFIEGIQRQMSALNLSQNRPRDIIMGYEAYEMFRANDEVQKLLPEYMRGANIMLEMTPKTQSDFITWKGQYGNMNLWVSEGKYQGSDGKSRYYIEPKEALFICDSIRGVRHYGAIYDLDAGLRPQRVFVKSWKVEDPSARFVLLQSAPLLVTYDPNTAALVTVA